VNLPVTLGVTLICLAGVAVGCSESDSERAPAKTTAPAPASAVATVGGTVIPRAQFDRWLRARFKARKPVAGQSPRFQRELLKRIVLQQLIIGEWLEQEASKKKVDVSDDEATSYYESTRQAGQRAAGAGGDSSMYDAALEAAKGAENARRSVARTVVLRKKLSALRVARMPPVSDKAVREYYLSHKDTLVSTEIRYFHLILTKERGRADQAKQALAQGTPWRQVSREFSIDDVYLRHPNGRMGAAKSELAQPLSTAVFSAELKTLHGPIHAPSGWYVFEVDTIQPARLSSFSEAKDSLRLQLQAGRADVESTKLIERLREQYAPQTMCARTLLILECKNSAGAQEQFQEAAGQKLPS
jgi:parvulin-like peptidyl-prolyl isomerase